MHERMLQLFKEYIVVGGMSRVVNEFVTTHNFANVFKIQKSIISDYTDDIAKYAEGNAKIEIDFFIRLNKQATAIEVKSEENIDSYPLYMAMFL